MKIFKIEDKENHKIYTILGIKIKQRKVSNNKILLVNSKGRVKQLKSIKGLKIKFDGHNSEVIVHTPIPNFKNSIITLKSQTKAIIGSSNLPSGINDKINNLSIQFQANNQQVNIGNNFSCTNGCQILFSKEENLSVEIGNDCMFASNIVFRPSDGHTIIDITNGKIVNRGKNITIKATFG